eukprot:tig00000157_g9661.t1
MPLAGFDFARFGADVSRELLALANGGGWRSAGEQEGVKISTKSSGARQLVKGEGIINTSPQKFCACIGSEGATRSYNKMIKNGRVIERHSENPIKRALIYYAEIGFPRPVWDRDMVYAAFTRCTSDGTCIAGVRSVEHPDVPERDGFVRAKCYTSGWIARPVAGEPDKSHVTYIANADLGGWLPTSVVNWASTSQALNVARARRLCAPG